MKARLERSLRRVGAAGVLGVGVLLACAGFYVQALAPAEEAAHAKPAEPASAREGREERADLERFYALFPSAAALSREVERVDAMAHGAGLELAQAEYRLERRPEGLWAYRMTLPVRGTYAQLRAFLSAVLAGMPVASIDALRFERKKALDTQIEAQVRLTVHARPAGDLP